MTPAAETSALKPSIGRNLVNFIPSVLMMRQPPANIPREAKRAQETITHRGTATSVQP
jgi:hypothetical protein